MLNINNKTKKIYKYIVTILSILLLIILDQWTKHIVSDNLSEGKILKYLGDNIEILYYENAGAAFGILQGQKILFTILTVIVIILLSIFIYRLPIYKKYIYAYIFSILLFAGTIGNFIDRIRLSYVVDFIYVKVIDFPIFNLADSYITISCIIMILSIIFVYKDNDFDFIKKR